MSSRQKLLVLATLFLAVGCNGAVPEGTGNAPSVNTPVAPVTDQLPTLSFRPDALLEVSFGRDRSEIYGFDAISGRLEPLTVAEDQDNARKGVLAIAPSPNGDWFAYARGNGHEGAHGVCVRPIRGGRAQCRWERVGDLTWRPGTSELWITRSGGEVPWSVLEVVGGKVKKKQIHSLPNGHLETFSPDGSQLIYSDASQYWIASAASPVTTRSKWEGDVAVWLNPTQVVAAQGRNIRLSDLSGKILELPSPEFKGREIIGGVQASPNGRYVGVSFGLPGAVFQYSGSAALYDVQGKTWKRFAGTISGWSGDGKWCVVSNKGEWSLLSPESLLVVPFKQRVAGSFESASPDGDWLVFREEPTWTLYQISTGQSRAVNPNQGKPVSFTWVPKVAH